MGLKVFFLFSLSLSCLFAFPPLSLHLPPPVLVLLVSTFLWTKVNRYFDTSYATKGDFLLDYCVHVYESFIVKLSKEKKQGTRF